MPRRARIGTDVWSGHVAVPGQVRPERWPAVDTDALPEARRTQFQRRKTGIVLYVNGASEADIRAACGFGRSHIYRHNTERCLVQHPDRNVTRTHGTQLRLKLKHNFSCMSDRLARPHFSSPTDALIIPLLRVSAKYLHRAPAGLMGVLFAAPQRRHDPGQPT